MIWRRHRALLWFAAVTVAFPSVAQAQDDRSLAALDTNRDRALSAEELAPLFAKRDPECAAEKEAQKQADCAALRAADFISGLQPFSGSSSLPIDVAQLRVDHFLQERSALVMAARRAEQEKQEPRPSGWQLNRTISDPAWFSAWKEERPLVLSAKHDNDSSDGEKRDSYVVLGSVGYDFPPAGAADLRSQRSVSAGLEIDSDSAKESAESSVSFVVPVQWSWAFPDPVAGLDGFALKVQPKLVSDRAFDREVAAIDMSFVVAKESVAIGYLSWSSDWSLGTTPLLSFHWNPTLTLQALTVEDAGGNENLAKLEGEGVSTRAIPRVQMTFGFPRTDGRLSFALDGRAVWDEKSGHTLGYGEGSLTFKLSRFAELALIYRRGHKGDELDKVDELLAGIGVKFGR
jgi:hypothetical protein